MAAGFVAGRSPVPSGPPGAGAGRSRRGSVKAPAAGTSGAARAACGGLLLAAVGGVAIVLVGFAQVGDPDFEPAALEDRDHALELLVHRLHLLGLLEPHRRRIRREVGAGAADV